MTGGEFCGTVAASFSTDHMAEEDCPTCQGLVAGGLQCIACGRMVAAAHGDPLFDLGTQHRNGRTRYDGHDIDIR